jgi:hypothetical protein
MDEMLFEHTSGLAGQGNGLMADKRDILGDLLTGSDQESLPGLEELSGLLVRPAAAAPRKVARNRSREYCSEKIIKKKVTYYLSPDTIEGINITLPEIRRTISEGGRKQLSKSQLVDTSMQLLLRDFEEKGESSLLIRHLKNR